MSDGLLQQMSSERGVDSAQLQTPELAITIDSMEEIRESGPDSKPTSAGGWEAGMEVTQGVRLVTLIADGGMGSVWVATHTKLGTEVAVKLVAPALLEKQPTLVERLDREAAALGRLQNPNIVEIYEHGTTANGTPYIVMELLRGVTLWRLVRRHGPLNLAEVTAVVEQVANGLSAAHREGIIHRDIKPQNIVLFTREAKPAVKVIDFGIAKEMEVNAIASVTKTGTLLGTPHFMSPEQLLKPKTIDARTDLWSLAVVAYYAMVKRFPFDGETLAQLFSSITTSSYAPPSTHSPHIPPELDAWMAKALSQEPQNRFRTVRELSTALRRIVAALPTEIAYHRPAAPLVDEDDEPETTERPPRPVVKPPESGSIAVISSPGDGVGTDGEAPKKKLLPYPFALLQDGDTLAEHSAEQPLAPEAEEPDAEERLRKILIVAALVAIVSILVAIVSR